MSFDSIAPILSALEICSTCTLTWISAQGCATKAQCFGCLRKSWTIISLFIINQLISYQPLRAKVCVHRDCVSHSVCAVSRLLSEGKTAGHLKLTVLTPGTGRETNAHRETVAGGLDLAEAGGQDGAGEEEAEDEEDTATALVIFETCMRFCNVLV